MHVPTQHLLSAHGTYNLSIHLSPSFLLYPLQCLGHFYPQYFLWGQKGNHRPHKVEINRYSGYLSLQHKVQVCINVGALLHHPSINAVGQLQYDSLLPVL